MTENELLPKKRPLMGLLIAGEDSRDAVLQGHKNITIREGWRDYHTNDKVLIGCPDLNWCVMAKITSVNFYALKDVPHRDLDADGFATVEDAIIGLSAFYDSINEESPVTVIRWQFL
jgi:hypothetical protein